MTTMHMRENGGPIARSKHVVRIKHPIQGRAVNSFYASQLAKDYQFPVLTELSTYGILVIELANGYPLLESDVAAYCAKEGLPVPPLNLVAIDGAITNDPAAAGSDANGEIALDIQNIIGATGGLMPITVVFTSNTSQGFVDAIQWPVDNPVANIVAGSISWGSSEPEWEDSDVALMNTAFQNGNAAGVSYFASSGDDGSADGESTGNNCDFPASSPFCCGCGGTTRTSTNEKAWSYGGGGYSALFGRPSWQTTVGNPARMVPDVAADADPNTGYNVIIEGEWQVIGGTSAVSPMWAALTALMVAQKGVKLGFLNAALWSRASLFTDIVGGSNGAFQAVAGPDPCTGLGVPNAALVAALVGNSTGPVPPQPPIPVPPQPPIPGPTPTPTPIPVPVPTPAPVPTPVPVPPPPSGWVVATYEAKHEMPAHSKFEVPVAFGPGTFAFVQISSAQVDPTKHPHAVIA